MLTLLFTTTELRCELAWNRCTQILQLICLGRSQAPLSIVLTALSTLFGAVLTPVLALLLLGKRVPVDALGMAMSIFQIVIAPVASGTPRTYTCKGHGSSSTGMSSPAE